MRGGEAFRASRRRAFDLPPMWAVPRWPRLRSAPELDLPRAPALADWPDAPLPEFETPPGIMREAEDARGLNGSAPEGTSGAPADEVPYPANADQACNEYQAKAGVETVGTEHASQCPAVEPVSRAAAGRSAAATSELMDVTAGETAPVSLPGPAKADASIVAVDCGSAALPALPAAPQPQRRVAPPAAETRKTVTVAGGETDGRAGEIRKTAPAIDYARLAAAARARPIKPARPVDPAECAAVGRVWCRRCCRSVFPREVARCERIDCDQAGGLGAEGISL